MGLEVYRSAKRGRGDALRKAVHEFRQAVELAVRGPMARELFAGPSDASEIEMILHDALNRLEL